MKKIITIWISCSLALAAGAMAQQENPSPTPGKKQHQKAQQERPNREAHRANEAHPARNGQGAPTQTEMRQRHGAANAKANAQTRQQRRSETNAAQTNANTNRNNARTKAQTQVTNPPAANQGNPQGSTQNARATKKPDVKVVQKIKAQHANFHAQARPQQVPSVTFHENYRISGSQQWQGPRYAAFRSYHPQRHDQAWYRAHYSHIVLIGGGYYYWNAGYWYPAWGYSPSASYYAYNGPIYTGTVAEPPDRVIANVQAVLQDQGYYKGEVDGLLGPLTREALTGYQSDHGLYTTAAIDEPTLESLGMSS